MRFPGRGLLLALLGAIAASVLYAVLLRAIWLPGHRTLELDVSSAEHGTITVFLHLGRGYAPNDALTQPLSPGRRVHRFEIPFQARSIKIKLATRPADLTIERVALAGHAFARGDKGRKDESRTVLVLTALPPLADAIPGWGHALCALLATLLTTAGLAIRRIRTPIAVVLARAREPAILLSPRGAVVATALFGSVILALATCADVYGALVRTIDNPPFWPISIFDPIVPGEMALLRAMVVCLGFLLLARVVLRAGPLAFPVLLVAAAAAAVASNALGGWERGLAGPLDGPSSYLRDAMDIRDPGDFLSRFTDLQRTLRTHSRTHPPGAVLVYHGLHRLVPDPAGIALLLGILVPALTCAFTYGVARRFTERPQALLAALVLASVPALQIYSVSSLDAIICAAFTGVLYCFLHPDPRVRYGGTVLALLAASSLTFAALFLAPVLLGYDLLVRRSVRSVAIALLGAAAVYLVVYLIADFSWLASFRIASSVENPQGFRLLHSPGAFLFTRLEGIVEILLFAGPVLTLLAARGLGHARAHQRPLFVLVALGALTLLAMFLTGAFKTGETARACLFFYPYLVLPLASLASSDELDAHRQLDLVGLLMAQTLGMQLFGDYVW